MDIIYLIITGMFVGLISSFFGVGGGSIMVPILFMLFPGIPAQAIIPSSLGVIMLNSLINNYHFYREGLSPKKKTVITLAVTTSIGALIGASLLHSVDSQTIKKLFGIMVTLIAFKVLFGKDKNSQNESVEINQIKMGITGFIGAFISSISGLGGGIVFVPMLLSFIRLPVILISPYSNVAMSFATLVGLIPNFFYPLKLTTQSSFSSGFVGHVNLLFILVLFSGALVSSKLGAKLNGKVDFKVKKYLLTALLLIFALKTLI